MFLRWLASTASTSKPGNVKPANALLKSVSRKVCRLSMYGSSVGVKLYAALHNREYDPSPKARQGPKRPSAPNFAAQQYYNVSSTKAGAAKARGKARSATGGDPAPPWSCRGTGCHRAGTRRERKDRPGPESGV